MTWDEVQVDPELASLIPPLSNEERQRLEISLLAEGCRDPLLAWRGPSILLDGHNRLELCRRHDILFAVRFVDLPDRAAARAYTVALQLERRNLTPEAAAYLRGKRYLAEKLPQGGDRSGEKAADQFDRFETARRLAQEYKVGEATIRRDARFARAVDALVGNGGEEARNLVLARDTGLTRGQVLRLADKSPAEQKEYLRVLKEQGKRPRHKGVPPASITLPREPRFLVEKLVQRLGRERAGEVFRLLGPLLERETLAVP